MRATGAKVRRTSDAAPQNAGALSSAHAAPAGGSTQGYAGTPRLARRATPLALGRRILVVEDDENLRRGIRRVLEVEGYRVDEVADGEEALGALRSGPRPDLLLTDIVMPGMDGIALLERLKRDPTLSTIPVVVMTGSGWSTLASAPVARGYLLKPFDPEELLGLLRVHAR